MGVEREGREDSRAAFERWQVTLYTNQQKTAPRAFSCAGPTADQQYKLIREKKPKS